MIGRWFCRWRNLKRVLLAGACLAALIGIFYAEEDWRGWHAWNQFRHEWEAKGEHFNLASAVPAPLPDEQNFALTPIAFTSYGQVLTRDGKLIPVEKRDEHSIVRMRMPLTHDALAPTKMEAYCVPVVDAKQNIFSPAVARRGAAALAAGATGLFSRFGRLILPVLRDAAPKFAYGQASVDLARTALALERCRLAQGQFPQSLEALTPQFIAQVPKDVIGGRPLKYRREADGSFILYSVGWNETDERGAVALNQDGSVDPQSGDWVWRYPARKE
jgi:hypothetical protein